MSLITCQNLCIGYDSEIIQSNISFSVNKGDYLCIVGENGAGKSTLMKTLINLIPPVKGKIQTGDGLKRNQIGYLPQQTVIQRDFPATVIEIVLSGFQSKCSLRPFYTKEEKNIAINNLDKMGTSLVCNKRDNIA